MAGTASRNEKIESIVRNFKGRGQSRPRKLKTLENTINSLFTKELEGSELLSLIDELKERRYISVSEGKVSDQLT